MQNMQALKKLFLMYGKCQRQNFALNSIRNRIHENENRHLMLMNKISNSIIDNTATDTHVSIFNGSGYIFIHRWQHCTGLVGRDLRSK
jgi:hypothetical protein